MRYKLFGRSGLQVSELCLGTLEFGVAHGTEDPLVEAREIFECFAEAGGNFLDTSDDYGRGLSEEVIGDLVQRDRDHFVIATKYGTDMGGADSVMRSGSSRRNMRRCIEGSLRRLNVEAVDVLYLHMWDFTTQWPEILSGLDDLVRSGKVHYIAISDTPAWEISRAMVLSEMKGWESFAGVELQYNLCDRTAERELLPMAVEFDLAVTAWAPLAGGVLAGRFQGAKQDGRGKSIPDRTQAIAALVENVAHEIGATMSQVALAWLRQRGAEFGHIFPIVGADSRAVLHENLGYLDLTLSAQEMDRLNDATKIDLGFPYDILLSERAAGAMTAQNIGLLDNHRYRDPRRSTWT